MKELLNEVSYTAIDTRARKIDRSTRILLNNKMRVISVAGILRDSARDWSLSHSDKLPAECTVADIADSSGEWTALAEDRDRGSSSYVALSDYAGYAPVFYTIVPGIAVIVSTSFNGAVRGLLTLGGSTSFNIGNYLTLLTGRARTFETLVSSTTMANEISILKPGEALFINDEQAEIVDRQQFSGAAGHTDYKKALTAAVEYTSRTISNYVRNNTSMVPLITLTGGVDSRLVLAFLQSSGCVKDFRVWTMDPRNKKSPNQRRIYTIDVEIANQIRKAYGLEWMPTRERQKVSVSFAESLARHQSFNSNYSFQFYPSKYLLVEKDPILTLRGGGGEILRGTSGAQLAETQYKDYLKQGGKLGSIDWATSDFLSRSLLTKPMRNVAHDFLAEQLNGRDTSSVREILDVFYKNHRNRAHFGHHRISETKNDFILQVLSNPYMQRLVDLSNYEYLSTNGIVLDLFNSTEPKLRRFPFESDAAHKQLYKRSFRKFKYKNRDSWKSDFNALKKSPTVYDYGFSAAPGIRGENTSGSLHKFAMTIIEKGFKVIEELAPSAMRADLAAQHQKIFSRVVNQQIPLGRLVAVVASVTDMVTPMPLDTARHFYTAPPGFGTKVPPRSVFHRASEPYRHLSTDA